MNITINRAALAAAVSLCLRVVDEKAMPVLRHARLMARGGKLNVAATDLNLSVSVDLPCKGADGSTLVEVSRLFKVLANLDTAEISLSATRGSATIKGGRSTQTLAALDAADFPKIHEPKGEWLPVEPSALSEVFRGCQASICRDETRFHLVGVLMETSGSVIRGISTDGHRMAVMERPAPVKLGRDVIVPEKGVKLIVRVASSADAAELCLDGFWLHLRTGDSVISVKCIDGAFPPYRQVIPNIDERITVDRASMVKALQRVSLAAADVQDKEKGTAPVKIQIDDDSITMSANNGEGRIASDELECDGSGGGLEIGIRASYLVDALESFSVERVELRFANPLSPLQVVAAGETASASVGSIITIMPMRL